MDPVRCMQCLENAGLTYIHGVHLASPRIYLFLQKEQARSKHIAHSESSRHHSEAQRRRSHEGLDKSVRRSTRDHRRGLLPLAPKKGGGGGKYTWGRPGDEAREPFVIDKGDPIYDPAEDDAVHTTLKASNALTPATLASAVRPIIQEYFDTNNAREAGRCLYELDVLGVADHLAAQLILAGIEQRDAQRELTSKLLSDIHGMIISHEELARGFDIVFDQLDELAVDVPDAASATGKFIARALGDDILAPRFVQRHLASPSGSRAVDEAVTLANALYSSHDGIFRLHTIWGVGGPFKPVNLLIQRMQMIVAEFFVSIDRNEAERALTELAVPHFHHEFVYEVVVAAMDAPNTRLVQTMDLLEHLFNAGFVARTQIVEGLARVASDLTDIILDVPHAHDFFKNILGAAADAKLIQPSVAVTLVERAEASAALSAALRKATGRNGTNGVHEANGANGVPLVSEVSA